MRSACLVLLLPSLSVAATDCDSYARCNQSGTAHYQAGRHAEAEVAFARQVDFAETARYGSDDPNAEHRRQIALNNWLLALIGKGACGRAAAVLEVADASHKATQANARAFAKRCPDTPAVPPWVGQYGQYAGHGEFNTLDLSPTGDETLRLHAFWMRPGMGPLFEMGPAAFGDLDQAYLHETSDGLQGRFDGLDRECTIALRADGPKHIEVRVEDDRDCQIGGAGTFLGGRYRKLDDEPPPAREE